MRMIVTTAAALALVAPMAQAQALPQTAPQAAAPAAAKFDLDTPIEALVADPRAKAVLDDDLPGTTTHPSYEMFKSMSLRAVQPYSNGKLTDEALKKVEADLAAIR